MKDPSLTKVWKKTNLHYSLAEERLVVRSLREDGLTLEEIGERMGRSVTWVRTRLRVYQ